MALRGKIVTGYGIPLSAKNTTKMIKISQSEPMKNIAMVKINDSKQSVGSIVFSLPIIIREYSRHPSIIYGPITHQKLSKPIIADCNRSHMIQQFVISRFLEKDINTKKDLLKVDQESHKDIKTLLKTLGIRLHKNGNEVFENGATPTLQDWIIREKVMDQKIRDLIGWYIVSS